mmetsp:Transcript_44279/g.107663  ORF Transcript_44279/g.107663 Transcript_44279/m.107663 type:complete len:112 (+) Transcript_44279:1020-1355(+)
MRKLLRDCSGCQPLMEITCGYRAINSKRVFGRTKLIRPMEICPQPEACSSHEQRQNENEAVDIWSRGSTRRLSIANEYDVLSKHDQLGAWYWKSHAMVLACKHRIPEIPMC